VTLNNEDPPIIDNFNKGQPLPDLGKSFHVLEDAFLTPGETVHIKVEYSNCRYIQDGEEPDIDGCTLFAFLLPVELNEVHFDGDKYWELWSDSSGVSQESEVAAEDKFSAPQYVDANGDGDVDDQDEKNHAVAYTRNTKPKIKVELKIPGAASLGAIKIKADGSDGITIPETTATVSGDTVSIPLIESTTALPNTSKFYDKEDDAKAFKLDWQIKVGNSGWSSIGETKHTVYVTHADPLITQRRQETLFLIGCKNAEGETSESSVISGIWSKFTDRNVKRKDGEQLGYYQHSYACSVITTEGLLSVGDGTCDSWAKFLADVLRIQGIAEVELLLIQPNSDPGMLIKNWNYPASPKGISPNANYPYVNLYGEGIVTVLGFISWDADFTDEVIYPWRYIEVIDAPGIEGQNRNNPASIFTNHVVVKIGANSAVYYDAPYGELHLFGAASFSDNSVDGYWTTDSNSDIDEPDIDYDLNFDSDKVDLGADSGPAFLIRKKSTSLEVSTVGISYE